MGEGGRVFQPRFRPLSLIFFFREEYFWAHIICNASFLVLCRARKFELSVGVVHLVSVGGGVVVVLVVVVVVQGLLPRR